MLKINRSNQRLQFLFIFDFTKCFSLSQQKKSAGLGNGLLGSMAMVQRADAMVTVLFHTYLLCNALCTYIAHIHTAGDCGVFTIRFMYNLFTYFFASSIMPSCKLFEYCNAAFFNSSSAFREVVHPTISSSLGLITSLYKISRAGKLVVLLTGLIGSLLGINARTVNNSCSLILSLPHTNKKKRLQKELC